jgi:hypothetical protein
MARGSVFRKNGGWPFRVDAGFQAETGKRRQLLRQGFGTTRAAEEALADAVGAATRGMRAQGSPCSPVISRNRPGRTRCSVEIREPSGVSIHA